MDLIPEELRRAHEDGGVVFFCGAGVSMPAGLPSFKGLVEAVLADLLPKKSMCKSGSTEALAWQAIEYDKYDEALDILESPREGGYEPKDVRERVHNRLSTTKTKTLQAHFTLARLADLDTDRGRLVTTNFDHLFERAQAKLRRLERSSPRMTVYVAPALPPAKPDTLHGLIHLHGKLGSSPENRDLVLTMANFGTAYMLEGWARRFVIDLFRHYHVVFIGYRVEDPTMRYLVSALAASREESQQFKEPYAFAPYGEDQDNSKTKEEAEQEWKLKGLTPLAYDNSGRHLLLWQELKEWADDHRQGIMGRRQKVAQLGQFPPVDENDPAIREIVWALQDVDVAKYIANATGEDRPNPGWIAPMQRQGLLSLPIGQTREGKHITAPLVSRLLPDHLDLNEVTFQLGRWIANSLDSQEALDWALSGGGVLHSALRWQVKHQLAKGNPEIRPALCKLWRVLADDEYAHALSAKHRRDYLSHPRLGRDTAFATRIFLNRLRPIPVFKVRPDYYRHENEPNPEHPPDWCEIEIELVGIEGEYDIKRFQERANDWEGALATMAEDVTTRLREAMDWLHEFELAFPDEDQTYFEYRSISPHEQNKHAHAWTQLIALARDSYDALVSFGDEEAGARLARRWKSLPYPVFRRLTLYAATGGRNA
ncbi:MAG: SIR2 family protein [Anaerolineales bacterium]